MTYVVNNSFSLKLKRSQGTGFALAYILFPIGMVLLFGEIGVFLRVH